MNFKNIIPRRLFLGLAALVVSLSLAGCGGGGGSPTPAGSVATVKGTVLLVTTNAAPVPGATIKVGSATTTASTTDGSFTLSNAPATGTTLTISAIDGAQTVSRTITVALTANATKDLGVVYLSSAGYTATASGRIVTQTSAGTTGVGNAVITLAGISTTTDANGAFTISNLPVGLGNIPGSLVGEVTATGFGQSNITAEQLGPPLGTGANPIPNILIFAATGGVPLPPYTITGKVTLSGAVSSGVGVRLISGANTISTTTTSTGFYTFWVVPGIYTVTATQTGFTSASTSVTLTRLDTPVTATTINLVP